ncbi:hypothetical protein [Tropicimonas sp. IMCC34011]|uniref:hypothetical protein n=1 Tax=Tropicimonas sp. IMCC34011 TaxID=2248759 RepID=UPI000E22C686|nr:hypothetical protein [Tropicimonas sp. IMCC34011]
MMNWIYEHQVLVSAGTSIVTAFIWVVYLHVLVLGQRRQRRSEILISIGAGTGLNARCFISNLGFEPIYIHDLLLTLENGHVETSNITDRSELSAEELNNPAEATNQGPLKSGDFIDIGSYGQLINRVREFGSDKEMAGDLSNVTLTVIAANAAEAQLVAAKRTFRIEWNGETAVLRAATLTAQQIRGWFAKRRLRKFLEARL